MRFKPFFLGVVSVAASSLLAGCFDPNLKELHLTSRTECSFQINENAPLDQEITVDVPGYYNTLPKILEDNGLPGSTVVSMIPKYAEIYNPSYETDSINVGFVEGIDVFFYGATDTIRIASTNVVSEAATRNEKISFQEIDIAGQMNPSEATQNDTGDSGFKIVYILRSKPPKPTSLRVLIVFDVVGSL